MLHLLLVLAACDAGEKGSGDDADGDGYGASVDCDDASSAIHPGADETCDGLDDDCDDEVDEGASDAVTRYADADGDGYGDDATAVTGCDAAGATEGGDCDDGDGDVHPGAVETDCAETRDLDCDGQVAFVDEDGDGWSACEECDDARADAFPGAAESCNGLDDDCDDEVDEDATDAPTWYRDADRDGYGVADDTATGCEAPDGYVAEAGDCADTDDDVAPGATEHCDEVDEDCDGEVDEGAVDGTTWYPDADGDGYGDSAGGTLACDRPAGAVTLGGDCDDGDAAVEPGASEVCDPSDVDEDCDGLADDDDPSVSGGTLWYADADGDGYGDAGASTRACSMPAGYVAAADDCGDGDAAVSPAGSEVCGNGVDDDCDGTLNGCGLSGTDPHTVADERWEGLSAYDYLGIVAFPGDVDDDGIPDVALGAWGYDTSSTSTSTGRAYVVGGASLSTALGSVSATLTGASRGEELGLALDGAGDIDGDGIDDLLAASPDYSGGGRAYVFFGPITSALDSSSADVTLTAAGGGDYFGYPARGVGDLDGDGNDDLAVGAYGYDSGATSEAGGVGLYLGPLSGTVSFYSADTRIVGATSSDRFGAYMAGAGDYDGDGYGDVAASAVGYDNGATSGAGAAYIFAGPPGSGIVAVSLYTTRLVGTTANAAFGHSLTNAGDVDGDGYDDLLVGAYDDDGTASLAGAAYLFRGSASGIASGSDSGADAIVEGETSYDETGEAVSGGDIDADGLSDLVVGQPTHAVGADSSAGRVLLFYGPVSGTVRASDADWLVEGSGWGTYFGSELDASGDVDLDGADDILVGGYGWNPGSTNQGGGAWLFLGGGL